MEGHQSLLIEYLKYSFLKIYQHKSIISSSCLNRFSKSQKIYMTGSGKKQVLNAAMFYIKNRSLCSFIKHFYSTLLKLINLSPERIFSSFQTLLRCCCKETQRFPQRTFYPTSPSQKNKIM